MFYTLPGVDPWIMGWIVKYARKNYWKVQEFMELEDLIHDGIECYLIACAKYPDRKANNPKHFMATVKLIFANHIPYIRNRNIRMPGDTNLSRISDIVGEEKESDFVDKALGSDEFSDLCTYIVEAPEEFRKFFRIFIEEADETIFERLREPFLHRIDGTIETTNEKLCRAIGVDPKSFKFSIRQSMCDYLLGEG